MFRTRKALTLAATALAALAVTAAASGNPGRHHRHHHHRPNPTPPPVVVVPQVEHVAVCNSAWQTVPQWMSGADAAAALQVGWWEAYAVAGNVPDDTNVGDYHLVCQQGGLTPTGSFVGGNGGQVFGPEYAGAAAAEPGWYEIVA